MIGNTTYEMRRLTGSAPQRPRTRCVQREWNRASCHQF